MNNMHTHFMGLSDNIGLVVLIVSFFIYEKYLYSFLVKLFRGNERTAAVVVFILVAVTTISVTKLLTDPVSELLKNFFGFEFRQ